MSGNTVQERKLKTDSRIRRTRDRLGDALIDLVQEQPFDEITVQHVLDRAGVARSTFYVHYCDKDDLLLSDVDEFLEWMSNGLLRTKEQSQRIAPAREFFEHLQDSRELLTALAASGKFQDLMDLAKAHFARSIDRRLSERAVPGLTTPEQRSAMSQAYSGALFSLLTWWVDRGMRPTPAEMDDLFHSMVRP